MTTPIRHPRGLRMSYARLGIELFAEFDVHKAWDDAGNPYPKDADFGVFNDLSEFALATQKIHLGLDYRAEQHAGMQATRSSNPNKSK